MKPSQVLNHLRDGSLETMGEQERQLFRTQMLELVESMRLACVDLCHFLKGKNWEITSAFLTINASRIDVGSYIEDDGRWECTVSLMDTGLTVLRQYNGTIFGLSDERFDTQVRTIDPVHFVQLLVRKCDLCPNEIMEKITSHLEGIVNKVLLST